MNLLSQLKALTVYSDTSGWVRGVLGVDSNGMYIF
jgi:hypothetical protein